MLMRAGLKHDPYVTEYRQQYTALCESCPGAAFSLSGAGLYENSRTCATQRIGVEALALAPPQRLSVAP